MPATWFISGAPRFNWYYKRMRLLSEYVRQADPDIIVFQEIRYDEIYGTMRFYAADTKENWVTESVMSAHIRGGSSRLNPKKSYKMTLYKQNQTGAGALRKNKLSFLGMRTDDEWLLYAMYSEDSKVRDKLSQDIWNESGALGIESTGFYGYHMEYLSLIHI